MRVKNNRFFLMGLITTIVLFSIIFAGCLQNPEPSTTSTSTTVTTSTSTTVTTSTITLPNASSEEIKGVVQGNNRLAFDLYSQYKDREGNIFFSPYSISTALSMTYEGARGQTAQEMRNTLHLPKDNKTRQEEFQKIYQQINNPDKNYSLHTANALWAQEDYTFLDSYFDLVREYYFGNVTNLNFQQSPEKSRIIINDWVENQTRDRIKDLIPSGSITPMTRLVLTNAIYFKGTWLKQFNESMTRNETFYTPQEELEVPLMNCRAQFNYTETENLKLLELPYSGKDLSMLILLPRESSGSSESQGNLSIQKLNQWKASFKEKEVKVYLPRFKFKTKYFMAEDLQSMGMPTAFSDMADFSGMTGKKDLSISDVIHQAFVEVNEEGTEAAAATAVTMEMSAPEPRNETKTFRADHPFIFLIQDRKSENILFMGRLNNPAEGA